MTFPNGGRRDENHPSRRVPRDRYTATGSVPDGRYEQREEDEEMEAVMSARPFEDTESDGSFYWTKERNQRMDRQYGTDPRSPLHTNNRFPG